jgi:hypothetical protein
VVGVTEAKESLIISDGQSSWERKGLERDFEK